MLEVANFKGNHKYDYTYGTKERKDDLNLILKNLKELRDGKKETSNNRK
mgnify:CR=1 FL=1